MKNFDKWMDRQRKVSGTINSAMLLAVLLIPAAPGLGIPMWVAQVVATLVILTLGTFQTWKWLSETRKENAEMERRWAEEDAKLFGTPNGSSCPGSH